MSLNELIQVGSRIKKVRKEKGISQKYMAEDVLKIPRSTYSNYENNNRTPDLETLEKIAEALEVEVPELLGIEEPKKFNFELNDILNEKLFEVVEYIVKDENLDKSLSISAIDFYKKDKYLNELILKSLGSIIRNYIETLKEKILQNPKKITQIEGDILINYPIGNPSEIHGVYNLGHKDEYPEYFKYYVVDTFKKYILSEYSKIDYDLPIEEVTEDINSINKRIESLIKSQEHILINAFNSLSLEHPEFDLYFPDMFSEPGRMERLIDILNHIVVEGMDPPSDYLMNSLKWYIEHYGEKGLPKYLIELIEDLQEGDQ